MKKVKRIIAGMAAAVMAFSTMSIGASADSWGLYISGSQAGNKTQDDKAFNAQTPTSSFHDSCTTYSQSSINGWPAYVTYFAYYYNNNTFVKVTIPSNDYAYYATASSHSVPLNHTFSDSAPFYVRHILHQNGYLCTMSGQVYIP